MKTDRVNKIIFTVMMVFVFLCACSSCLAAAEETVDKNNSTIIKNENNVQKDTADEKTSSEIKYKDYFSGDLRILSYGIIQEPTKSTQNPDNNFLQIPQYRGYLEARPDLFFKSRFLDLSAKPREKVDFQAWEEGNLDGETKWDDDFYINEWLVRLKAWDRLFVSYGRENLQWGPSFLFSPSNPFFSDNGRINPFIEIPGMDFGRVVMIPHNLWTVSFIVNTDEGRNIILGPDPFENTYAVKIDFTGRQSYASVIVSYKDIEGYDPVVGFFGGWTVSDAIILYGEGSLTKGSRALYPQKDFSLLGISMQKIHLDDSDIKPVILAGGSYTFENSGTLTLEYMYNAQGYNSEEADLYYTLRQDAAILQYGRDSRNNRCICFVPDGKSGAEILPEKLRYDSILPGQYKKQAGDDDSLDAKY